MYITVFTSRQAWHTINTLHTV